MHNVWATLGMNEHSYTLKETRKDGKDDDLSEFEALSKQPDFLGCAGPSFRPSCPSHRRSHDAVQGSRHGQQPEHRPTVPRQDQSRGADDRQHQHDVPRVPRRRAPIALRNVRSLSSRPFACSPPQQHGLDWRPRRAARCPRDRLGPAARRERACPAVRSDALLHARQGLQRDHRRRRCVQAAARLY